MKLRIAMMLLLAASPSAAQQHRPDDNPFARHLHAPDLVRMKQLEIGLKEPQREQIKQEVMKAQTAFTELQFRIAGESEKVGKLLQAPVVDEAKVLAQVDQILAIEREIKRTHVALLVRIHNLLTPEQREKLMKAHH